MSNYENNFKWADKFIDIIGNKIGRNLLRKATPNEDINEATDLKVIGLDKCIAVRIRKNKFIEKYANQFTIRLKTISGNKTEFEKIKEGYGDWMFYGWANEDETDVTNWMLIDLDIFRKCLKEKTVGLNYERIVNTDGSEGMAFWVDKNFSEKLIIDSSKNI